MTQSTGRILKCTHSTTCSPGLHWLLPTLRRERSLANSLFSLNKPNFPVVMVGLRVRWHSPLFQKRPGSLRDSLASTLLAQPKNRWSCSPFLPHKAGKRQQIRNKDTTGFPPNLEVGCVKGGQERWLTEQALRCPARDTVPVLTRHGTSRKARRVGPFLPTLGAAPWFTCLLSGTLNLWTWSTRTSPGFQAG